MEVGSFAGAADRLDISRGMATKYVAALERQLNVRLLHRTTRKLTVTEAGSDYVARVAAILAQVDDVDLLEEEFDQALWTTLQRSDERLVAHTLIARIPSVLVAAPSYLAERGTPQHPSELTQYDCLHHNRQMGPAVWTLELPEAPYDCHAAALSAPTTISC